MSHPLLPLLQTLSQSLASHPHLTTSREIVAALDKVTTATQAAIELLENAAAGSSPEAQELQRLLERAFEDAANEKTAKAVLKTLLSNLPTKRPKTSSAEYLTALVQATVKSGNAAPASLLIRKHLDAPKFDTSTKDEYELLKQIRQLGQMDTLQKKAAKAYLTSNPELVTRLCEAASIPTSTKAAKAKVPKPVSIATLVNKLIQHGERYAENAGS